MLLMIDNYDSFTYNLVQYLGELGQDLKVYRNNKITIEEIETMRPERIVISPGPCTPREAGISIDVIKHFAGRVPLLGVCLGHQSIGEAFGGRDHGTVLHACRLVKDRMEVDANVRQIVSYLEKQLLR